MSTMRVATVAALIAATVCSGAARSEASTGFLSGSEGGWQEAFRPADEVENHHVTVGQRRSCVAIVRSYDDGSLTVQLRGAFLSGSEGATTTGAHVYRKERTGIANMVARFGRDC